MIVERLVVGMLQTNCYIVGDPETRQAAIIDPGGDADRILARVQTLKLEPVAVLLTHGHFDHVLDAWTIKERTGSRVFLNRKDEPLLTDSKVGLGTLFGSLIRTAKGEVDHFLEEGDRITFGSIVLEVLETPGHTPGHVSFLASDANIVFVGDTLFAGSIGRTDFPGGSYPQLIRSVQEKIFPLPGQTLVCPGHGPETTVEQERRTNPFFR